MKLETRNVVQISIAFFLLFVAFFSHAALSESIMQSPFGKNHGFEPGTGFVCIAITHLFLTVMPFFVMPLIQVLGWRIALTVGSLPYAFVLIGYTFMDKIYLYIAHAAMGTGGSLLWICQGNYVAMNSTKTTITANMSIFSFAFKIAFFAAGIISLIVFSTVGSDFSQASVNAIYITITICSLSGSALLALLPHPPKDLQGAIVEEYFPPLQMIVSMCRLLIRPKMLLLSTQIVNLGLLASFLFAVYPTMNNNVMLIPFNGTINTALNMIALGVGTLVYFLVYFLFGRRLEEHNKLWITSAGTMLASVVMVLVALHIPSDAALQKTEKIATIYPSFILSLATSVLLGVTDMCITVKVRAALAEYFGDMTSQAFGIFEFYAGATIVIGLCVMAFVHPTTIVIISGLLLINVLGGLCFMALVATSHEITKI